LPMKLRRFAWAAWCHDKKKKRRKASHIKA